jgi:hypothetical protein
VDVPDARVSEERTAIAGAVVMIAIVVAVRLAGGPVLLGIALGALAMRPVLVLWLRHRERSRP